MSKTAYWNQLLLKLEDSVTNQLFKKTTLGVHFYPCGYLMSGYLVSEEMASRLRKFILPYTATCLGIIILSTIFTNYFINLAIGILLIIIYFQILKKIFLLGSQESLTRLTFLEHLEKQAKSISFFYLRCAQVFSLVFVVVCGTNLIIRQTELVFNILLLIAFSCLLYINQKILRIKKRLPKDYTNPKEV